MVDRTSGYAEAVIAVATAEGALDVVETELRTVAQVVDGNADLRQQLGDVAIPASQRLKFVEAQALQAAHPATRTALAMLIVAERIVDIADIATKVSATAAAARDRDVAEVHVASPLDAAQQERLLRALEEATGKTLDLRIVVDPTIVGGVRAQIGDTVIDGSIAKRIDDVRTRIGA
jgi:F-type H+-transporting ATPase subunit delta